MLDVEMKNKKCNGSCDRLKSTFLPGVPDNLPSIVIQALPEKTRSATPETVITRTGRNDYFPKRYTA